jgi:hypothetical protein
MSDLRGKQMSDRKVPREDARKVAELALDVGSIGYEWKQRAVAAEARIAELERALRLGVVARQAQSTYFRNRTRENLIASKQAEKAFDDAARDLLRAAA